MLPPALIAAIPVGASTICFFLVTSQTYFRKVDLPCLLYTSIVGCPTYNTQMYPEMEALLSKLASREIKGRYLGYFGSFTWASACLLYTSGIHSEYGALLRYTQDYHKRLSIIRKVLVQEKEMFERCV